MSQLELPKGWLNCQFKDIVLVNPKVVANDEDLSGFIPMSHAPVNFFDSFKYDERNWGEIKKKYTNFADGDVIFAKVTPCFENGKAALLGGLPNGIGAGSSEFYVLRPLSKAISSKYIFSIIKGADFLINGERNMTGAVGLRRVPRSFVEGFEINLPPLAEQQVIADKLDTLLAQVESIKARLERIHKILKQFRQSVLVSAVSGKLTEEWRGSESTNWKETTFFNLCTEITVGFVGKMSDKYQESGIPFLRSQNVRAFKYSDENLLFISEDFHKEIYKSRLEPGDLAIVRSGAPGTTCVIPESLKIANCSDLVIARPSSELVSEFGCIFMNSEVGKKNVKDNQVGVAQQHFNVGSMKKMPISLPPVDEQYEIVKRVESHFRNSEAVQYQVQSALDRVNNLTQSILAKAFRGELTAEWREANPELISGENSAEALLDRIKAERELAKPATKRARGKA